MHAARERLAASVTELLQRSSLLTLSAMGVIPRLIIIPLLSLLPCLLWLWYFSSRSVYKRPSRRVIAVTFWLGGLATILALGCNLVGQQFIQSWFGTGASAHVLLLFLVVGPIEELAKLLVVYFYAYRRPEFDEPLDGVIYSAAAALGFAAAENLIYLWQSQAFEVVLLRGPLSNPGHALFSALWGLALSRAKAAPNLWRARLPIVAGGWLAATVVHALFDTMLILAARVSIVFFLVLLGAMAALFFWVRGRIRFYRETSPHREGTLFLPARGYCQECGTRGTAGAPCVRCGAALPLPIELRLCAVCATAQRPAAKFCARCGANLKLPAAENVSAHPHFVAVTPAGEERIAYILNRDEVLVGRTLNNGFVIDHPSVSKRHARVVASGGAYALDDLGSSNGTFVDGLRVVGRAPLRDGCEVRFGHVHFVYRALAAGKMELG
ncbi:MAG TPA: PrsW family glutamic-type intramembrane protease [Blastocatellia bacterium]|nr:PrsW family glutamic-type intramembrane protease [Blastocatellia bacterium]